MARDVPKAQATILVEGQRINGNRVRRYLDAPPTFEDMSDLVWVNITGLRPIILRRPTSLPRNQGPAVQ